MCNISESSTQVREVAVELEFKDKGELECEDKMSLLPHLPHRPPVDIQFSDLSYAPPPPWPALLAPSNRSKHILQVNISQHYCGKYCLMFLCKTKCVSLEN